MWVCRAGKNAVFLDYFIEHSRIYLAWEGFKIDLKSVSQTSEYRTIVGKEKKTDNRRSVSNWAGQLNDFANEMQEKDYVFVPYKDSHFFALVRVAGPYEYDETNEKQLYHTRMVDIIAKNIPKNIFPQSIQYGLRAYRTIYRVKNEEAIMTIIMQWMQKEKQN